MWLALFLLMVPSLAHAGEAPSDDPLEAYLTRSKAKCPTMPANIKVVAIGSSTMKGALAPMLRRLTKKQKLDIKIDNKAKSSTGLARPDFFDWHKRAKQIAKKGRPDIWLVSMGTNDYQAVREGKKTWHRPPSQAWKDAYAARVRGLLEIMSGPDRKSAIVYIGSTPFKSSGARRIGPKLNEIVKQEIAKFDGPAVFYNIFSLAADAKNNPREHVKAPQSRRKVVKLLGEDNTHMTRSAVKFLLASPALRLMQACAGQQVIELR